MKSTRTYLDPIHREIILDFNNPCEKLICDLIDTPEFPGNLHNPKTMRKS